MPISEITLALCGGGIALGWVGHVLWVAGMRKHAEQIRNTSASKIGHQAKEAQEERMLAAFAEGMQMVKNGAPVPQVIQEIGAKYPDVAAKLIKKAMKGELPKGLMGGD
jgi:hypothetical protein